jgi:hypothetical protein
LHPARSARTSPSTFPFLPSSQCQRADLGSPARGRRRWKRCFLIFADRRFIPVSRQHLCPFRFPPRNRPAQERRRSKAMAVYIAGSFCCQHPWMTKSTFLETPDLPSRFARAWNFVARAGIVSHEPATPAKSQGKRPEQTRRLSWGPGTARRGDKIHATRL